MASTDGNPSRDPVDRITDAMLTKPIRLLTPAERGLIRRAINGARAEDFMEQRRALRRPTAQQA